MVAEEWRPVVGHEGRYEVSNLGSVRSVDQVRPRRWKGRVLKPVDAGNGYLRVYIAGRRIGVHRIVADAFVPNPDGKPHVLHWDDDKSNNAADNLRWGTQSENEKDKIRNGKNSYSNRTHCPRGHEYTPENTRVSKRGFRFCRTCPREVKATQRQQGLTEGDERHGTVTGYNDWGCRCGGCRAAFTAYAKKRRALAATLRKR